MAIAPSASNNSTDFFFHLLLVSLKFCLLILCFAVTSLLTGDSDDDGQPNAYDYNDSFLDDSDESASSLSLEDSEDSDWDPGSDSDLKELVSEAKGFLRNKKMHKTV